MMELWRAKLELCKHGIATMVMLNSQECWWCLMAMVGTMMQVEAYDWPGEPVASYDL